MEDLKGLCFTHMCLVEETRVPMMKSTMLLNLKKSFLKSLKVSRAVSHGVSAVLCLLHCTPQTQTQPSMNLLMYISLPVIAMGILV